MSNQSVKQLFIAFSIALLHIGVPTLTNWFQTIVSIGELLKFFNLEIQSLYDINRFLNSCFSAFRIKNLQLEQFYT